MTLTGPSPEKLEQLFLVPYQDYLDQGDIWPSIADGHTSWTDILSRCSEQIANMAPQHAVGALHKLVRWAVHAPAGDLITIADVTAREEYVRVCPLGRALAARALGLTDIEHHAITQGAPANINHLVGHVMVELVQRTPLEPEPAMELSISIVTRLTDRYTITERES